MLLLCALIVGSGTMWAEDPTNVTINFGTTTGYWAAHTNATYTDSDSRVWTRTCSVSNMSGQGGYSQFGNASNTCGSLVFTATAGTDMTVTAFSVTMAGASGGNSPTTGTIYLYKVSGTTETQLATLSVNGSNSVTCSIESSQSFSSTDILKVSYAGTAKAIRISKLEYSYTTSGGDQPTTWTVTYDANGATSGDVPVDENEYDTENSTVTVLGNTGDLAKTGCAFDGWNTQANGGGTTYAVGSKFNISANTTLYAKWTPYTITALSNNESYGTVSLSDNVITGSPNSGYRYADPAYTVAPENSATVAQDGNTFTVTPTANTTITINFEAIPTHTATFSVNGTTTTTDFQEGAAITFPANPADIEGKSFVGWTETAISGTTDEKPTFVTSATMGEADVTYYAVFAEKTETAGDVTKAYGFETESDPDWTISGPVRTQGNANTGDYSGRITTNNTYVIFNNKVKVKEFSFAFKKTSNNNNYNVYIETSTDNSSWTAAETYAMSGFSDVYSTKTKTFEGNTEMYIRFHCNNTTAERFVDDVTVKYDGTTISYSGYCTTVAADNREEADLGFEESTATVEWYVADQYTGQNLTNPNNVSPITWTSSNEGVATVENGTVKVLALGETTIKASFDGDNNYKKGEASYVLTVQDSRTALELSFDPESVEVNVNETVAIPTLNGNLGNGAVTYASDDANIATVTEDANTSLVVTGLAEGTTTITATVAATNEYKEGTATFTVTVIDPNAPGTVNNPYTVAQAIAATPASGTTDNVYIKGIVSQFYNTSIVGDGSNYRYYISDDGTKTTQLLVYKGKGLNNTAFANADDLQIGDEVIILGKLTTYQNTKEVASGNYIVSLLRKPTFSPEAGTYPSAQTVTISTITEGATIYYTTDGTDPTTESNLYSEPIEVNTDMTIKAIAVKDSEISTVATAKYVINLTPSIVFDGDQNPYDVPCTAGNTNIHYVASNITGTVSLVICDANGGETTYDWFRAAISSDVYVHVEWDANDTETRTAYFKLTDGTTTSEIFALTQAQYVPDYATLPFEFDGGRADIEETNGLTQDGLDSDYGSSPYLKFNSTNDYVILKINEIPGTLTFDIKGNSFSGGTFTVQTSADGVTYTDLQTYTELGNTQNKTFDLTSDVRYIRWIYTYKANGNVALGNITLGNTSMAVTIAAACTDGKGKYYGTFSSSSAFVVPENLTVSEIGIDDEGKMNVQNYESGAVVPANTGVMVSATSYGNFKLDKSSEAGTSVLDDDNALRPTGDNEISANDMGTKDPNCLYYRLTMHGGTKLGFWWGAENGGTFGVAANKAYMVVPDSSAAREGFAFDEDSTTGISNVNVNENVNGSVFDLQGRKVSTPGKGLYIVNGKKVVIK